jgi:hypothetical protein
MWWQAQLMGCGGFDSLLGFSSEGPLGAIPSSAWFSATFVALIIGGLIAAAFHLRARPELGLLLLWFLLPTVLLSIHRVMFHYFIACWPVTFLFVAFFGEAVWQWLQDRTPSVATWSLPVAILIALGLAMIAWEEVGVSRNLMDRVSGNGGFPGEYGICYRQKLEVARYLIDQVPDGRCIVLDRSHPEPDAEDYRYLARWLHSRQPGKAQVGTARFPRPPTFVVEAPYFWFLDYEPFDPGLWRDCGYAHVGTLTVHCFVPVGGTFEGLKRQ